MEPPGRSREAGSASISSRMAAMSSVGGGVDRQWSTNRGLQKGKMLGRVQPVSAGPHVLRDDSSNQEPQPSTSCISENPTKNSTNVKFVLAAVPLGSYFGQDSSFLISDTVGIAILSYTCVDVLSNAQPFCISIIFS